MVYRKIIGLVLLSLFSICSYSQNAAVIFQGKNQSFQVSINSIKQHSGYNNNIKLSQLKGNMPYNVKINFENDSDFVQTNIYLIDDGLAHIYNISKDTIQLKKVVPAVSYIAPENQLAAIYTINNNLPIDTIVKDTTTKDTAYVVPFANYYKMENYEGKIGCPWPIKSEQLSELKGVINAQTLEESKLDAVKEKLLDIDSVCFTIDQVKELLILFEFEETKLDFAKSIASFIFDINNIGKLEDVFDFENSIEELKKEVGI